MAKRQKTKRQTMTYKILHTKQKIKQFELHLKPGWTRVFHQWHPSWHTWYIPGDNSGNDFYLW